MPRIDPIQLLNCLGVLLSPNGGIKSRDEVQRLANLMTKFSRKLVSKCIYIQILKCTETELLGLFMGSGGWLLVHTWLKESKDTKNLPLIRELLELLLVCPVDIERLKTNNCPKLVKELSKEDNQLDIRALASKLVEQWLKTVKGEQVLPVPLSDIPRIIAEAEKDIENTKLSEGKTDIENGDVTIKSLENTLSNDDLDKPSIESEKDHSNKKTKDKQDEPETAVPILKISLKDDTNLLSQSDDSSESKVLDASSDGEKPKDKSKTKSKDKSDDKGSKSSSKSSSSRRTSKSHSSDDKHRSSHKSNSSRHSSSKDKSKDKHSSHSSKSKSDSHRKSSSSSKSKDEKEKSSKSSDKDKSKDKIKEDKTDKNKEDKDDKNKDQKSNEKSPSIHKLGKIPKINDVKKEKPSISIEIRKQDEPKPKTVKTFNSKFRKHGLEEEVKPPPSRAAVLTKKATPVLPPSIPIPKRPIPIHNETPPEKKIKTVEPVEKPGAIKLIPPKPKPMLLLESDMFMDALNASATNKKDPKKRKRRTSGSKDGTSGNDGSPPQTPTSITSPTSESKSVPPRFYQDTLEVEENKEKQTDKISDEPIVPTKVVEKDDEEKMDTSEPHTLTINGLKGVLCYHKRKGPKKSIKWKPDSELEEVQYFELDETERVNVTKTFTDMKYLERINEREAFQKARNLSTDDVMEERTIWRPLILVDVEGQIQVEHGKNSKEKDIQAIRQKGTLQPLYFSKAMIPDSALEPEPETHPYSEPTIIPLEDVTGNQDNVSDFRNMPWPEPKGNAPPVSNNITVPNMFPGNMNQFANTFPNPQFPGVPGFQGGNMLPSDWPAGVPPHIIANGIPTPILPGAMPPGSIPPGMMMPPENMMTPEMFGGPAPMFPVPPEGFNIPQNMFPMDFNMSGPPGSENFPGPGNFRGPMRGRGSGGGHWRGKNAGNWDNIQRGRGGGRGGRKAVCIYFQRKGSCRQGENCSFLHPGVNCPF